MTETTLNPYPKSHIRNIRTDKILIIITYILYIMTSPM